MQKLSVLRRLSTSLLIMSVIVAGVLVMPIPTRASITCYEGAARDLYFGAADGDDVLNLQKVLNNDPDTQLTTSVGSPGYPWYETTHFGLTTENAVKRFQTKYNIVTSGTVATTGYGKVGPATRTKLTSLYGCSSNSITVANPTSSVVAGTSHTIRWTTLPASRSDGVIIKIFKGQSFLSWTLIQQFGTPINPAYDYNNDDVLDQKDSDFLASVIGGIPCPSGKVCDLDNSDGGTRTRGGDVTILINYINTYTTGVPDNGLYVWNVPATLEPGSGYVIQVVAGKNATISGTSGQFTVATSGIATSSRFINVVTPTAMQTGSKYAIRWTSSEGGLADIIIRKGTTVIASWQDLSIDNSFDWNVPANLTLGNDYKITVALSEIGLEGSSGLFSIVAPSTIAFISPASNEHWEEGTTGVLRWKTTGTQPGDKVRITLIKDDASQVTALSASLGDISNDADNDTSYSWITTPLINASSIKQYGKYSLLFELRRNGMPVTNAEGYEVRTLNSNFNIDERRAITVTAPVTGTFERGQNMPIRWTTTGATGSNYKITVLKGGVAVAGQQFIATSATALHSYGWIVPAFLAPGNDYKIRVEMENDSSVKGESGVFSVVPKPLITVSAPVATDQWKIGKASTHQIKWTSVGLINTAVKLELVNNSGAVAGTISTSQANATSPSGTSNSFNWTLNQPFFATLAVGGEYKVRVSGTVVGTNVPVVGESAPFTILEEDIDMTIDGATIGGVAVSASKQLTIGKDNPQFVATITNKGVRTVTGVTITGTVIQASTGARGAASETQIGCATVPRGVVILGSCTSSQPEQVASTVATIGTFSFGTTGNAVLRVEAKKGNTIIKTRDFSVTLIPLPLLTLVAPNGGETWEMGGKPSVSGARTPYTISWKSQGAVGPAVSLELRKPSQSIQCGTICDVNNDGRVDAVDEQLIAEFRKHDFNGDNRVDRTDLDMAYNAYLSGAPCAKCDLTGDGDVRIQDTQIELSYILKLYDINGDESANSTDADILRSTFVQRRSCATNTMCDLNLSGSFGADDVTVIVNYFGTSGYTIGPSYQYDLNNDGMVNTSDIDTLAPVVVGTAPCPIFTVVENPKSCDLNSDGRIDAGDTLFLSGIITSQSVIAQNVPNRNTGTNQGGSYQWYVKDAFVTPGDQYQIVVRDINRSDLFDESDSYFSIAVSVPTITSPVVNQSFIIDPNLQIKIHATTPGLQLTRYRIRISQNSQSIYESNPATLDTLPFLFNGSLLRASDGRRLIELLRQGDLIITLEGNLLDAQGKVTDAFTPPASRTVKLSFNRNAPTIVKPVEGEEVNLGDNSLAIRATHPSKPALYRITIRQNGVIKYQNNNILADTQGVLNITLTKDTRFSGKSVFTSLDKGEVEVTVSGALFEGFTNDASRIFRVVPVPPDFDLNDDLVIDVEDFKILQLVVLGERLCPADKDCDLNRDGAVNVADLATMVAHPLYQKPQQSPSVPKVGTPVSVPAITSPRSGGAWNPADAVIIQEVAGASGYLVGFVKNNQMIYENYRDGGKNLKSLETTVGDSGTRIYQVPVDARDVFTSGTVYIYVRALVNNQWTDSVTMPVTIGESGSQSQPPSQSPPQQLPQPQPPKVIIASPQPEQVVSLRTALVIYIQKYPGAVAYNIFITAHSEQLSYRFDQNISIFSMTNLAEQNQYAYVVIPQPPGGGRLQMRVQAIDASGKTLAYSDFISFFVKE
ncbi:hypothetical protein A3J56_03110 [Candidatus Giovannonibacteria bacterium RIFCSPHIGHO2_02_FULL_46_20]|uniref:EF-hand domain-containing protein n=1 Tax=Candidatus Giovannonibacteria bacterium RIFCSPHIGHO2_02_FULL_46_20 TaxID=1798338 RepID=A0A1F5WF48_9BACT|nr:MAG: hypothetical protein A3J56_03110 [Candidatus Giovannonibacteria bacterium RIFCSPHIGHO2_02_FULL_46_20]